MFLAPEGDVLTTAVVLAGIAATWTLWPSHWDWPAQPGWEEGDLWGVSPETAAAEGCQCLLRDTCRSLSRHEWWVYGIRLSSYIVCVFKWWCLFQYMELIIQLLAWSCWTWLLLTC